MIQSTPEDLKELALLVEDKAESCAVIARLYAAAAADLVDIGRPELAASLFDCAKQEYQIVNDLKHSAAVVSKLADAL